MTRMLAAHINPFLLLASSLYKIPNTTESYTLSLHDALPILEIEDEEEAGENQDNRFATEADPALYSRSRIGTTIERWIRFGDRKSTRLNSSHVASSYAVFCLKKKKTCNLEKATQLRLNRRSE